MSIMQFLLCAAAQLDIDGRWKLIQALTALEDLQTPDNQITGVVQISDSDYTVCAMLGRLMA